MHTKVCVCVFTKRTLANPLRLRQVDILDIRNMWQDGECLYHISSPVQLFSMAPFRLVFLAFMHIADVVAVISI